MSVLIADVGGTNSRLAIVENGDMKLETVYQNKDHTGLKSVIETFLNQHNVSPEKGLLALACPIESDKVFLTNLGWHEDRALLQKQFGFSSLTFLNDFEALALSLPFLPSEGLTQVKQGEVVDNRTKLVLGPGTGLGVAGLFYQNGWHSLVSEGGHNSLAGHDIYQDKIIAYLREKFSHCSAERLLSGPGIENLYQAICHIEGQRYKEISAAQITERAFEQQDALAAKTMEHFFFFLGSVAGNLAMSISAYGGVYLAGGILPRFQSELLTSSFNQAFMDKGRFSPYMAKIPVYLVTESLPALIGLREKAKELE